MSFSNEFNPLRSMILRIKTHTISISSIMNRYRSYKNLFRKNPKILLKLINKLVKAQIRALKTKPIYSFIAKTKFYQLVNYKLLRGKFFNIYNKLRKFDIQKFTTDSWDKFNNNIEDAILPFPRFSFLNHPVIRETMFLTLHIKWIKEELKFLEKTYSSNELRHLLLEDYIGIPEISNLNYSTSNNSIHHFYSICKFLQISKCNLNEIKTIVEWGGGYGNMSKILLRLIKKKITYIIIDTPTFSCIQWIYLASIFGIDNVNLIGKLNEKIEPQKINILPVCFVEQYKLDTDLFISTWALNESSKNSQDFVVENNWFNAKHFLLAYEGSSERYPFSHRLNEFAIKLGLEIEKIKHLPGGSYAFK